MKPPAAHVLSFEGQGGVRRTPAESGTLPDYTAQAMIGGKPARVGARLIDGVALKLADRFFSDFNRRACETA